jgi:signal transduction histidine kinase
MVELKRGTFNCVNDTNNGSSSLWRTSQGARCCLVLLSLFVFPCLHIAFGENAVPFSFQTASSVLALDAEQARRASRATLHGVVTCATDFGIYLQDRTAGIWVDWSPARDFAPGDEIEVIGHTGPGLFSPVVLAESIRKLGRAQLPRPKEVTLKQLLTGDEDAQYVTVTGVVRSVSLRPNVSPAQRVWLRLAIGDGFIFATLPENDGAAASGLIDAVVKINAPATCTKNLNRQFTSVLLATPGINNVTVIRPPPKDMFALPVTPMGKLTQFRSGTDSDHRVRVTGTVTYYKPGDRLIIEDQGRALLVMTTQIGVVKPGDQVDAFGFPTPASSGPYLQDASFRYVGRGNPPRPAHVTVANLSSGTLNYNLVSFEGKLLRHIREPNGQALLLQSGPTLLRADLGDDKEADALMGFREGSTVRVTGISVLEVEGSWNWGGPTASAVRFTILLRSPKDVEEIAPPSWWTASHLFYLAAVLAILVFVFFVLALYGRMEQVKLGAILTERERLAHEIHDTLAQSFAGIGFQMQAIRRAIPGELPELRKQVDLARALVRHSHTEARRSIEPLQRPSLENADLLSTLCASARKMVSGGTVEVSAASSGQLAHTLPERVSDALLHIGQEAVANAVRHADPHHIAIAMEYKRDCVCLTVSDDGCGFEERGDLLGFGLRGMRKRCAAISATFEITSKQGEGTRVNVVCPVQPSFGLASFLKQGWKFLTENQTHGA